MEMVLGIAKTGAKAPFKYISQMKYTYLILLMLSLMKTFSQKREIQIADKDTKLPIVNALVFNKSKLISKSDSQGQVLINLATKDTLNIVKEDYQDIEVELNNSKKIIYLEQNKTIHLNEVIISKANVNVVLDSVYKKITFSKDVYKNPKFSQDFNLLTSNNDTLLYFNNRLLFKPKDGYYCSKNKIIANFERLPDVEQPIIMKHKFKFEGHETVFFTNNFLHNTSPSASIEFQIITKFKKEFQYKLEKSEGYYKITFYPQKNNKEYPYSGYIIVDIEDFGVCEFKVTTIPNVKSVRTSVFNDKILNYNIKNEDSFVKYQKNLEGKYDLINYVYNIEFVSLNGELKGRTFINKYRKEKTLNFEDSNLYKINLSYYKPF